MIIYLSGPMRGYPQLNYPAFNAIASQLRGLGYQVLNPVEIVKPTLGKYQDNFEILSENEKKKIFESCMRADIKKLMDADTVVLLDGWKESQGAILECYIANQVGIECLEFNDFIRRN